jgi:hypothetical protein
MIGYLLGAIGGLLGLVAIGLLLIEVQGWLRVLSRFAIRLAARRLPAPYAQR